MRIRANASPPRAPFLTKRRGTAPSVYFFFVAAALALVACCEVISDCFF